MIIYAYTTQHYETLGWYKIGQTKLSADERISQQDGTSNPEPLIKIKEWDVPLTDKQIHNQLELMGNHKVRMDKEREWFKVSIEDVDRAINSLLYGVSRPHSFKPREEQQHCINQAANYFWANSKDSEFLINAKMRFGKTFVSYKIAEAIEAKSVLVLTYKPAVINGWKEDLETHVDFIGWEFNSGKGYAINPEAKCNVLFASFQDINDFDKEKWAGILDHHFDLVVIDEMHYGSDTTRAKFTLSNIKHDKKLYVSGTPLDAIISGKFDDEQIYSWSYVEEQKKRRDEQQGGWQSEVYRWLPQMEIHTFEVSDDAKRNVLAYSDDEQFTMTKMFGSEDGVSFTDEATVKLFLDQVFGRGIRKSKSPIRTYAADHMLWVMPRNVKSVNAMCGLLARFVGDEYHILNVAGDNITDLTKVKKAINHYKKTITVTCGRFNTGVTVPEWDVVLMLNDGKSPETYFQTIFRVQSPDKARRKETCYVFDFNPERTLELVYTYAELTTKKGQDIKGNIRQFLEFAPIIDHSDNTLKQIRTEDVVSFVTESSNYLDRFTSNYLFNSEAAMSNTWILDTNIDGVTSVKNTRSINTNNLDSGKNYINNGNTQPKTPQQKQLEQLILEKAKTITAAIPAYVQFVDQSVTDVESLIASDPDDFEEEFEISVDIFKNMVYSGFINEQRVNRLIAGL